MPRAWLGLLGLALIAQSAHGQPRDPGNLTCPATLNLSTFRQMHLTPRTVNGRRVLHAEGFIDESFDARLDNELRNEQSEEIWLSSPGAIGTRPCRPASAPASTS